MWRVKAGKNTENICFMISVGLDGNNKLKTMLKMFSNFCDTVTPREQGFSSKELRNVCGMKLTSAPIAGLEYSWKHNFP